MGIQPTHRRYADDQQRSTSISTITATDKERAIATLTTAFTSDPVIRWVMPDPQQYLTYFPELIRRFAGQAFEGASGYVTDAYMGAALWLRPGVAPEEEPLGELIQEAIPESRQIGVDPARQGQGLGSALLSHVLAEVDREGKPAYLEASSERSRALYLRHGFEVTGTIQVADSPPFWPMLRKAR